MVVNSVGFEIWNGATSSGKSKWFKPQIELQWPSQLPVRSWYSLPSLSCPLQRLVEYDRRTGRLLNLKTFISDTFSSSQPSGAPTWRFGYDHVTGLHKPHNMPTGCGWLRHRFAHACCLQRHSSTFRIRRGRIPVYSSQAWPGLIQISTYFLIYIALFRPLVCCVCWGQWVWFQFLLVSLWRRWWISQPACWMVARISTGTVARTGSLGMNSMNWWLRVIASHCESLSSSFLMFLCIILHPNSDSARLHAASRCLIHFHPSSSQEMYILGPKELLNCSNVFHVSACPKWKTPIPRRRKLSKYASWYATGYPNELEHYSLEGNTTWNSTWKQQRRREYVCAMVAWRNDALCFFTANWFLNILVCFTFYRSSL